MYINGREVSCSEMQDSLVRMIMESGVLDWKQKANLQQAKLILNLRCPKHAEPPQWRPEEQSNVSISEDLLNFAENLVLSALTSLATSKQRSGQSRSPKVGSKRTRETHLALTPKSQGHGQNNLFTGKDISYGSLRSGIGSSKFLKTGAQTALHSTVLEGSSHPIAEIRQERRKTLQAGRHKSVRNAVMVLRDVESTMGRPYKTLPLSQCKIQVKTGRHKGWRSHPFTKHSCSQHTAGSDSFHSPYTGAVSNPEKTLFPQKRLTCRTPLGQPASQSSANRNAAPAPLSLEEKKRNFSVHDNLSAPFVECAILGKDVHDTQQEKPKACGSAGNEGHCRPNTMFSRAQMFNHAEGDGSQKLSMHTNPRYPGTTRGQSSTTNFLLQIQSATWPNSGIDQVVLHSLTCILNT